MTVRSPTLPAPIASEPVTTTRLDRIARWLLVGPPQLARGEHAGAVAGCVDAAGEARYAYPEITGYYLHWLAWQAARNGGDTSAYTRRAGAAQRWLARWLETGAMAPTRVPLRVAEADWRNDALFCFDVAMVLRGLAAAARVGLVEPDPAVIAKLVALLRALIATDGQFDACIRRHGAPALPRRWSTQRGAFLAKAAAGVISAAAQLPGIPSDVAAAAEATYDASVHALVEAPHDDVHPLLYACEGVLSLPAHRRFARVLPMVAVQFDALLAATREQGRVPESLRPGAPRATHDRFDIWAQAIRVGHLLTCHRPEAPPDRVGLTRIARALLRRVKPHGALPFASGARGGDDNVWATMFAEQALALPGWGRTREAAVNVALLLV